MIDTDSASSSDSYCDFGSNSDSTRNSYNHCSSSHDLSTDDDVLTTILPSIQLLVMARKRFDIAVINDRYRAS